MIKKVLASVFVIVTVISLMSCKNKEQQSVPKAPQMPQGQGMMPQGQGQMPPVHSTGMSQKEIKVVIPESVKGKWIAVRLSIEDKAARKVQEFTVNLNSEFKVPSSDLKIVVGEFLPGFTMDGETITSSSNELRNPAVGLRVYEGDKQIFPAPGKQWGWLFSKLPDIHPFEHPKYGITLKDGVKKG